ncbi:protein sel-1 homolog 1 [Ctenocephalides felis]|uniref:protein sel-1 homolog 1 n=1 Tax=Ctenocephalides felis TaxID=7515 RepID=UPI000E6E2818|nr:protein sel-1 homolog 1 [Ctenocephalides felis]
MKYSLVLLLYALLLQSVTNESVENKNYKPKTDSKSDLKSDSKQVESEELQIVEDLNKENRQSKGEKTDDVYISPKSGNKLWEESEWVTELISKLEYNIGEESLNGNKDDVLTESLHFEKSTIQSQSLRNLPESEQKAELLYKKGYSILNKARPELESGLNLMEQASKLGHAGAKAEIIWADLLGRKNKDRMLGTDAAKAFQDLAEHGLPSAHMGLGFLYSIGYGVEVSQSRALVHYTIAALGGNEWAQMALGYRYWSGITVAPSCEKALDLYRSVAAKVAGDVSLSGGAAVQRIRLLDELDSPGTSILEHDLIDYYQLLAEKGDIQAQVGLGQLHYQGGRGVRLDHQRALHYFTQAANAGNALAMAFLGKIYLEGGGGVPADNETALKYFRRAADAGNPIGQSGLGLMYLHGKGVEKDTNKALKYFTQAGDQGWVDGQLQLGNMYFGGVGVPRDFKLAYKYYSLASQSGHVLAFYNLGQMHASGMGMMRSCPTAVELFKNVAERGRWCERLMEAHSLHRVREYDSSYLHYTLLAELGYEVAQSNAAHMLDRGEVSLFGGSSADFVRALLYWGRAAAQGYSTAQVKLGDYHYYGLGTPVDYEMAASHYRLASEQQHNAQAMFNLGYMHEQGLGMAKDTHLAKRCYDLAAETSTDAKIPVAFALFKLSLMFHWKSLTEDSLSSVFDLDEMLSSNWDLYLISILTAMIGVLVYFRRAP